MLQKNEAWLNIFCPLSVCVYSVVCVYNKCIALFKEKKYREDSKTVVFNHKQ